ncbi:LiaF transmembrane domain-containing protein [Garciella nitratireducens]|nr:DUF5668 domain-containing protein [Garciella nitratireducens]
MKNRNICLGVLLILLGILWFLQNLNILDFEWSYFLDAIFDLWPLILIGMGIHLLVKNKMVKRMVWILFVLILVGYSFFLQGNLPIKIPDQIYQNQVYSSELQYL